MTNHDSEPADIQRFEARARISAIRESRALFSRECAMNFSFRGETLSDESE